jgi:Predicted nucleotide-binding protein containing TIR-like domain
VPEKIFSAMRRCTTGIIVVSIDETRKDKDGEYTINENMLIEIGAAFVLYDKRVVLLWDKRLSVPSNLHKDSTVASSKEASWVGAPAWSWW